MTDQAEIIAALHALRDDLPDLIRAAVRAELRPDEALVISIYSVIGDTAFAARDLFDCPDLTNVLAGWNARQIGKRLARLEGQDLSGLTVIRVGEDRDGATWQIIAR